MDTTATVVWNRVLGQFELRPTFECEFQGPVYVLSSYAGTNLPLFPLIGGLYSNDELPESKVVTIRIGDSPPLGYLLPLSGAFNDDAGLGDNNWYRQAAVAASSWALQFVNAQAFRSALQRSATETPYEELFGGANCVLILNQTETRKLDIVSVEQVDHQLFSLGFRRVDTSTVVSSKPGRYSVARLRATGKDLKTLPLPASTKHSAFLSDVFHTHIPKTELPIARFFFFYQIVEALMEEISAQQVSESLSRLTSLRGDWNSVAVRDEAKLLQRAFKEDSKLNHLFGLIHQGSPEFIELKELIATALASLHSSSTNVSESFYELRNQIFHNFRGAADRIDRHLGHINELLEVIIPDLVTAVHVRKSHMMMPTSRHVEAISDVFESNIL